MKQKQVWALVAASVAIVATIATLTDDKNLYLLQTIVFLQAIQAAQAACDR